ncbi:MAG: MotA/TolQ/ExbB proton channel family protein [Robiginitomaculum sp.]|nr:MotA/TolQ/ExbB proton channel family protein [Robiginitomaculum sp.]
MSKTVKKLSAFLVGCVLLVGVAMPASAQINSIGELLDKVRQDARQTQAENARREADFKSRRDQQSSKLAAARAELNRLEAQVRRVERQFEANEDVIAQLDGELNSALGEFRDVFGLARQSAGEFKATLDSSLVSAQYPRRTEVLGKIANSKALPSSTELDAIWKSMLGEIEAQRQVVTFEANVGNSDNPEVPMALTRVGGFNVFTNDGADFLEYKNTKEPGVLPLTFLNKQPGGQINKAAQDVLNAGPGDLVFGPVDPTRGSLLKALERVPTVVERVGNPFLFNGGHGGGIGVIIGWVLIIGAVFGIFNIIRLFLISSAVRAQKKKAQPSKSNPLGRVMMAYEGAKDKDEEIIELKLDEAILRESPKLEVGLNLLKLGAAIAPLLGLLGTVTGMIETFQAMMIYGAGDPQLMAGGISKALVTTMVGLIAAIPLLVLHSFCASLARGVQGTLEEQSAGIVARHIESRRG